MTKPIARDAMYRRRSFDTDIIELRVRWYISYLATADIAVENPHGAGHGVSSITFDNNTLPPGGTRIPLSDDGATHKIEIVLGS